MKYILCAALSLALFPLQVLGAEPEEPGVGSMSEEPGAVRSFRSREQGRIDRVRLELGAGYASLLADPDAKEGYGGGLYVSVEVYWRLGVEVSGFFARNVYEGDLGEFGASFLAGNISLGPIMRLTPAGSRLLATVETAVGFYPIVPLLGEEIWTMGVSFGFTVAIKITSWLGLSIKPRYHLFNLGNISGSELRDVKAFSAVGTVDRFELPLCVSFFF